MKKLDESSAQAAQPKPNPTTIHSHKKTATWCQSVLALAHGLFGGLLTLIHLSEGLHNLQEECLSIIPID